MNPLFRGGSDSLRVVAEAMGCTVRPRCFNRPPLPAGEWVRVGEQRRADGVLAALVGHVTVKPVLRWRPSPFADRCASWDATKIEDSVPARQGWNCHGCRLLPSTPLVQYIAALNAAQAAHGARTGRAP